MRPVAATRAGRPTQPQATTARHSMLPLSETSRRHFQGGWPPKFGRHSGVPLASRCVGRNPACDKKAWPCTGSFFLSCCAEPQWEDLTLNCHMLSRPDLCCTFEACLCWQKGSGAVAAELASVPVLWSCMAAGAVGLRLKTQIKDSRIGRESNPGLPRGRRAFYH